GRWKAEILVLLPARGEKVPEGRMRGDPPRLQPETATGYPARPASHPEDCVASALKRGCRFIVITFVLLLVLAAGAAFWLWQGHRGFGDTVLDGIAPGSTVEVARGDAFPTVLRKLREHGVTQGSDLQWRLLARETDTASQLKV